MVLRFLVSGLQRIPIEKRWKLSEVLLSKPNNNTDQDISLLLWYGVLGLFDSDHKRFDELIKNSKVDTVKRLGERLMQATQSK